MKKIIVAAAILIIIIFYKSVRLNNNIDNAIENERGSCSLSERKQVAWEHQSTVLMRKLITGKRIGEFSEEQYHFIQDLENRYKKLEQGRIVDETHYYVTLPLGAIRTLESDNADGEIDVLNISVVLKSPDSTEIVDLKSEIHERLDASKLFSSQEQSLLFNYLEEKYLSPKSKFKIITNSAYTLEKDGEIFQKTAARLCDAYSVKNDEGVRKFITPISLEYLNSDERSNNGTLFTEDTAANPFDRAETRYAHLLETNLTLHEEN